MSSRPTSRALRLVTGPAGSGKTHEALERVREAATTPGRRGRGASRPGDVLLVVPTYAEAMHVERVALSRWDARAVLDDPFATFTSAGERFLPAFRVQSLPSSVERDSLMEEALRGVGAPAFLGVRDRPGFRARLLRLVKEVKQSGMAAEAASARLAAAAATLAPDGQRRLLAFLEVFAAYEVLLARAGLEDHEDALRRLCDAVESDPALRPPRLLVVDGFDDFTPVEQRILDALAGAVSEAGGEVLVTLPADPTRPRLFSGSEATRRHLLGRGFVEERREGFARAPGGVLARIGTHLFGDAAGPPRPAGAELALVVAADPEDEAEAMAREARRRMAAGDLPRGWRDLGIVVRRLDEAGGRILAAFRRQGIPCRLVGTGDPLAAEALVRALRGPLEILGGRSEAGAFDAAPLLAWLRWSARAEVSAEAMARTDRLEIHWRRTGYPDDLASAVVALRRESLEPEVLLRHVRRLRESRTAAAVYRALDEAILELAPLPPAGGLDDRGVPRDRGADDRRRRAGAARDRLRQVVHGLAEAAARTGLGADVDAADAVARLLDGVDQARLGLPDRRLDAVNVMDAEEARFWEIPVVFVGGIAQGSFPLHPREDVVLRDDERDRLREIEGGFALPLTRDRETRERRLFYGALTRARRRLVLFRPGASAEGDARAPSLFLRDLERIVDLGDATTRRPPGRAAPPRAEAYTRQDWALFAAATARRADAAAGDRVLAAALLEELDDDLLRRASRWRRRSADDVSWTRTWIERFAASMAHVSATALNTALVCPRRHLYRAVARVPEDDVPFGGPTFGPRERGTLVHELLRRAVLEPEAEAATLVAAVLTWAEGEGRGDLKPLDATDRDVEARELERVLRLFRDRERVTRGPFAPRPDALELAFQDLELTRGGRTLRLRGQIDRVDQHASRAVVVDYKLSKGSATAGRKGWKDGVDIQLPLYAHAVKELLGLDVVGLEWVAARERQRAVQWSDVAEEALAMRVEGSGQTADEARTFATRVEDALDAALTVVDAARAGRFDLQDLDPKRCGTCPWRSVCRPGQFRYGVDASEDGEEA